MAATEAAWVAVTVVGYDGSPLPPGLLDGVVARHGRRRHLREVALPAGVRTVALRDDPGAALAAVADEPGDVVVLASGDPGFFGVVRAVRRAVQPRPVARGAGRVQRCARLRPGRGRVGRRGGRQRPRPRPARGARRRARAREGRRADRRGVHPGVVGGELAGRTDRVLLVGERLGLPGERVVEVTPDEAAAREWEQPNVVLVLDRAPAVVPPAPRTTVTGFRTPERWALPEDRFAHRDSMITKPEVRAHVLARLGPRLGGVVWDLGAGSGSVAVECARFGADVHAVERDADACDLVRDNAAAHGVHVHVVHGDAASFAGPQPDGRCSSAAGPAKDAASPCTTCTCTPWAAALSRTSSQASASRSTAWTSAPNRARSTATEPLPGAEACRTTSRGAGRAGRAAARTSGLVIIDVAVGEAVCGSAQRRGAEAGDGDRAARAGDAPRPVQHQEDVRLAARSRRRGLVRRRLDDGLAGQAEPLADEQHAVARPARAAADLGRSHVGVGQDATFECARATASAPAGHAHGRDTTVVSHSTPARPKASARDYPGQHLAPAGVAAPGLRRGPPRRTRVPRGKDHHLARLVGDGRERRNGSPRRATVRTPGGQRAGARCPTRP